MPSRVMIAIQGFLTIGCLIPAIGWSQSFSPTDRPHGIAPNTVTQGPLLVIGGGLLPNNQSIFHRLIEKARRGDRLLIGIFPTAASNSVAAERFVQRLRNYGVQSDQVKIFDFYEENASHVSSLPSLIQEIRECTALFFTGGDQRRITRAMFTRDGAPTDVFRAVEEVGKRGGLIAGSSAGAAVQCESMISVAGLPDDSIDDGMDALDFGITRSPYEPARRGILLTKGFGFFRGGIIDQHFNQRRGRLARLIRAVIEGKATYGFGIDENTAIDIEHDGMIEVIGPGSVTIVSSRDATCNDGPCGCRIHKVFLSSLEQGDRFDPATGKIRIHPNKRVIDPNKEGYNGNFTIPDIAGQGALQQALFAGLGLNTKRTQIGITLKHFHDHCHGYRFTFSKTNETNVYEGEVHGVISNAVVGIQLDIDPITFAMRDPQSEIPKDIQDHPHAKKLQGIHFRNILLCDDSRCFRPTDPITREELACAIAQTIRLEPTRTHPPKLADVDPSVRFADEIEMVVSSGLMTLPQAGLFMPFQSISREEAAEVFVKLAEAYQSRSIRSQFQVIQDKERIQSRFAPAVEASLSSSLLALERGAFRPTEPLSREDAALAIHGVLQFPW